MKPKGNSDFRFHFNQLQTHSNGQEAPKTVTYSTQCLLASEG